MMGWPMVPSADLYAGGPAYPLSSLGVRLRAQPTRVYRCWAACSTTTRRAARSTTTASCAAPSSRARNFNLRTGALFIAEVQYAINQPATGELVAAGRQAERAARHLQARRLVRHRERSPDQQYDNTGLSLADPASTGIPRHDLAQLQHLRAWRTRRSGGPIPTGPRAVALFARMMGAPGDRNLVRFQRQRRRRR